MFTTLMFCFALIGIVAGVMDWLAENEGKRFERERHNYGNSSVRQSEALRAFEGSR
jgi:hypothetical protein